MTLNHIFATHLLGMGSAVGASCVSPPAVGLSSICAKLSGDVRKRRPSYHTEFSVSFEVEAADEWKSTLRKNQAWYVRNFD